MKKIYFIFTSLCIGLSLQAQTTAGSSFYIDYQEYQTDGLLRYINCGNQEILNPGDNLSMEAWVKVSQQSVNDNLKIFGKFGLDNTGFLFAKEASEMYSEVWTPGQKELKAGFMPPLEHWAHIVCTFAKNGQMKGYINGILVGEESAGSSGIAASDNDLIIGIAPWDLASFQYFGAIDNIRIWNKELSAEEVRFNMHNNLDGSELGLIASYNFNDNLEDQSTYGNHGTGVNLSETNFQESHALISDSIQSTMNDVHGVWLGLSTGSPSVNQITENGLTVSSTVFGDQYILFGHNDEMGNTDSNLPENSPSNFLRQNREWYLQIEGVTTATLNFSLSNGAAGEESLSEDKVANYYTLLYRENTESNFTAIKAGNVKIGDVISFQDVILSNGYYTIAVGDEAIEELLYINTISTFNSSCYPNPSSGQVYLNHSEAVSVHVTDILGKTILAETPSNMHSLDLKKFAKGMYLIKMYKDHKLLKIEKLLLK